MSEKTTVSAIEGWFEAGTERPHLLGSRCKRCKTYFFPKESAFCRNPACDGTDFEEVPLSRTGRLWSFTNNCYAPPPPYVSADPFVPYIVAAVELAEEKMVVLGQVVGGVKIEDLRAGMPMELVVDTLSEDGDKRYLVWKWKPADRAGAGASR
jgi:uncharacterized OB-fold protein